MGKEDFKDDADLDDIMEPNDSDEKKTMDLEVESLVSPKEATKKAAAEVTSRCGALCMLIFLTVGSHANICVGCGAVMLVLFVVLLVFTARIEMGRVHHGVALAADEYSNVDSIYDLRLNQIDHWCIFGGDEGCTCDDPLEPITHAEASGWLVAHKKNKMLVADAVRTWRSVDVAFIGDSITEEWNGRWYGREVERLAETKEVFKEFFTLEGGSDLDAIALGVAGDTAPNLLWRLQNGEMPEDFNPRVWWLQIGINDLIRGGCSEEVTLLGILRVVEEIQMRKPRAAIVINLILPTTAKVYEPLPEDAMMKHGDKENGIRTAGGGIGMKNHMKLKKPIKDINAALQLFCDKHQMVECFDAKSIFTKGADKSRVVDEDLMPDGIHPTAEGHRLWAKQIKKAVDEMAVMAVDDALYDDEFLFSTDEPIDDWVYRP